MTEKLLFASERVLMKICVVSKGILITNDIEKNVYPSHVGDDLFVIFMYKYFPYPQPQSHAPDYAQPLA